MRKISLIILLVSVFSLFAACNSEKTPQTTETSQETSAETTEKQEELVRVTIGKNSLADPESFLENMKKYGAEITELTQANGYLLVFSKPEHEKLIQEKSADVVKAFKGFEDDENSCIEKIEYNEDFRKLDVYVDKDKWEVISSNSVEFSVGAKALAYQIYLEDGQKTVVNIIYSGTEDVVSSIKLPLNVNVEQ